MRDAVSDVFKHLRRTPLEIGSFVLVASVYAVDLLLFGYDFFYFDSGIYWQLGDLFERDGQFSLLAYYTPEGGYPRGYSLPLLNHGLQTIADVTPFSAVTTVKLWGALLAATLGVVVAPRLARQLFRGAEIGVGRVLAFNALLFVYWHGHFNFPLSDFPALLAGAVGVLLLLRAQTWGCFAAGLGIGLAANMRPAYIPALIVALAVAALAPHRPQSWDFRALRVALVIAGSLVAFFPQIAINHHHRGTWSPLIAGGKDLSMLQLSHGLRAQKFETYVGPSAEYPQPRVFYLDPATTRVLEQAQGPPTDEILFGEPVAITSYGEYARLVAHHPVEMAAGYTRRIFNGLDVRYSTPYIRDLGDSSILLSLLQYTLIFGAIARLVVSQARRALGRIRWVGVALLISPCLTAIPGAMEPRFFLPLYLLIYMLVCFGPATDASFLGGSNTRRAGLAASYIVFVVFCLWLSSSTQDHIEFPEATSGSTVLPQGP